MNQETIIIAIAAVAVGAVVYLILRGKTGG